MQLLARILDTMLKQHPLYEEVRAEIEAQYHCGSECILLPGMKCPKPKGHTDMCGNEAIAWERTSGSVHNERSSVHNERSNIRPLHKGLERMNERDTLPPSAPHDEDELEDEPVFILRARDLLGPEIVREWIFRANSLGVNIEKIEGARDIANKMEDWQLSNGRKIAD